MNKFAIALSLALTAPAAVAQCVLSPSGTVVADFNSIGDTIYPAEPIGFAFPLDGQTYTDIHLSDHGFAFLSNGGVPTVPAGGALTYNALTADFIGNGPCLSIFWADANLGTAAAQLTIQSSPTECVVTWSNITTFFGVLPEFTYQMTLFPSGEVTMVYGPNVSNYGSTFTLSALVGITPGAPAALPAMSDLSSGPVTTDPTVFEDFQAVGSFDMANDGLRFIPTSPGWAVIPLGAPAGCASVQLYGSGCTDQPAAAYEELPAGGFDLAPGTTITLLRQPSGYVLLDSIPGTIVPPTAAAINIAAGLLDGEQTVQLSTPMPIAGGTTSDLTITTKSLIALSANSLGPIDWTPTEAEFVAFSEPVITPMWHDFDQTAVGSGLILFEEVGGFAYATWDGVLGLGGSLPDRFQVQFEIATGNITIVYDTIANDGNNYLVGYKTVGPIVNGNPIDMSVDLAATLTVFDTEIVPLALNANAPVLGGNWNLTTTNIDPVSPIAITFFGDGMVPGFPGGLPLQSIGLDAPGCFVHINTILGDLTGVNAAGTASVSLPIPNDPLLIGSILTAQSLCLTLANQANILTSNAAEGMLGN